jgi:hypothetical protein
MVIHTKRYPFDLVVFFVVVSSNGSNALSMSFSSIIVPHCFFSIVGCRGVDDGVCLCFCIVCCSSALEESHCGCCRSDDWESRLSFVRLLQRDLNQRRLVLEFSVGCPSPSGFQLQTTIWGGGTGMVPERAPCEKRNSEELWSPRLGILR